MKRKIQGFESLTKEQVVRGGKNANRITRAKPKAFAKNDRPEFGVTRFANGQYLAQTITTQRSGREKHDQESPIRAIGIFDNVNAANQAYLNWRDQ